MQSRITTMIALELSHFGGHIQWYRTRLTEQFLIIAISQMTEPLKNVMMLWVMQYTMNLGISIHTAFIHHLACSFQIVLWGWKILCCVEGFLVMIHALRIMQKNTIIGLKCRRQCMLTLPEFLINGLLAGNILLLKNGDRGMILCFIFYLIVWWHLLFGSDVLNKNWKDSESSMLPIYKELVAAGLRIWVFR